MSTRVDGIMMFTMIEQILDKRSQKVNGQTRLIEEYSLVEFHTSRILLIDDLKIILYHLIRQIHFSMMFVYNMLR